VQVKHQATIQIQVQVKHQAAIQDQDQEEEKMSRNGGRGRGYHRGGRASGRSDRFNSQRTTNRNQSSISTDKPKELKFHPQSVGKTHVASYATTKDTIKQKIRSFKNAFTTGRNEWPKTLVNAYRTLSNWKRENTGSVQLESEGVSFGTDGATEGAGKDYSNAMCWRRRKQGHLKRDCTEPSPDSGTEANTNVQDGVETGEQLLLGAIEDGEFDDNIHFSFFGAGTATMDDDVPTVDATDSKLNKSVTLNIDTSKVIPGTWILLDNNPRMTCSPIRTCSAISDASVDHCAFTLRLERQQRVGKVI